MKTKDINTLSQLRQAKMELRRQMRLADREVKDNFIVSSIDKLFSGKKSETDQSSILDSGTKGAIKFLAGQKSNHKWLEIGKIALSLAITVAAPIIAKKLNQ